MFVPDTIVSDIASSTSTVFRGTMPILIIFLGTIIAFYIMNRIIGLLPKQDCQYIGRFFARLDMLTIITLPSNFTADIASTSTDTISSFSPFVILIIGVLLAGVVLEIIIGAIRHK